MESFVLIPFSLFIISLSVDVKLEQSCAVANVHITHEDGSQQVFRVKPLEPLPDECRGHCSASDRGTEGQQQQQHTLDGMAASFRHRHPDLIPAVTVVIGGFMAQCDKGKQNMPYGLCPEHQHQNSVDAQPIDEELVEGYANIIADKSLVPMGTGVRDIDRKLAYGIVLFNTGAIDEAIEHFTSVIKQHPQTLAAYHSRGSIYARKGLQHEGNAARALADFTKSISLDGTVASSYERRGEIYLALARYREALEDINKAIQLKPSATLYFVRGTISFVTENLTSAERDFRQCAEMGEDHKISALYYLGLTLYYRGKVRNAIEVFREIINLKSDYQEAHTSLAQAYREIGKLKQAKEAFKQALAVSPHHVLTLQLRGSMYFHSGESALALKDLAECLNLEAHNTMCQYMQGLTYIAQGQFYDGVKAATKVMVYKKQSVMKFSPEFVKAHYLREYSRYLHTQLDSPLSDLDLDGELSGEFKDHWLKMLPFTFKSPYREQPGLRPEIKDVVDMPFTHYEPEVRNLICQAEKIGKLSQVDADGFLPNKRLNLAMGLASIHIAQMAYDSWKEAKNFKQNDSMTLGWRTLFDIGVQYRRLVNAEQPVLWLDLMPDELIWEGYSTYINFVRGHVINMQMASYFDLVFKLVKTMVEHYTGDGIITYAGLEEDLHNAKTCLDLLQIAKKRNINQQGFMVSTQVPSTKDANNIRLEGIILTLTSDLTDRVLFSVNLATTKSRSHSYQAELDFILNEIFQEIRIKGLHKVMESDSMVNTVLSFVYYFYNWMPLSRGSSVVAYSVAVGLLMSVGREVTGKIPQGKLVDMEAMLSGAPDAFILVVKQWMNIKKMTTPLSSLPKVAEVFPTMRQVLEVLNAPAGAIVC